MQKTKLYIIDLTKIDGNGKISCPKCGTEISPEDTSEETYTVIKPVVKQNRLEKILLQCNNCQSQISLIGFNKLNKTANR